MDQPAISPAFHDIPRESQALFRTIMQAMAQPGRIGTLHVGFETPAPLARTSAAILLTLADFETPVWLDTALSENPAVTDFIRFHTGASLTSDPRKAAFALIADTERPPALSAFAQGTPEYPDRSTTVILQVASLGGKSWRIGGPGINGESEFGAAPLPPDFTQQLRDNNARSPLGVDVVFAGHMQVAALPRSTRIVETR